MKVEGETILLSMYCRLRTVAHCQLGAIESSKHLLYPLKMERSDKLDLEWIAEDLPKLIASMQISRA